MTIGKDEKGTLVQVTDVVANTGAKTASNSGDYLMKRENHKEHKERKEREACWHCFS